MSTDLMKKIYIYIDIYLKKPDCLIFDINLDIFIFLAYS